MTACDQKSATLWTSSYYCLRPSVQPKGRPDRGAPSAPQQKPLVYYKDHKNARNCPPELCSRGVDSDFSTRDGK
eukprot:scaffold11524_cov91-Cylindrotheca_fusiformis.AAC.2